MNPFSHIPRTSAEHFKLYFYAAVLHVVEQAAQSYASFDALFEQFPFLAGYFDEVGLLGVNADEVSAIAKPGNTDMMAWEAEGGEQLPLSALRKATSLDPSALTLLFGVGLIEEDARFGLLFEAMQPGAAL